MTSGATWAKMAPFLARPRVLRWKVGVLPLDFQRDAARKYLFPHCTSGEALAFMGFSLFGMPRANNHYRD
jgi:hypothetical protein